MRLGLRVPAVCLVALGLAACASSAPRASVEPAPLFTRRWSPYTPEELNRDVIQCAETARQTLAGEPELWSESSEELRRDLYARTGACMERRGWQRIGKAS
jgi:hypothetical protein